jgi:hypothetical protein
MEGPLLHMRRKHALFAIFPLAAACTDNTGPAPRAHLVVQQDTIAASLNRSVAGEQWIRFTVPVAVRNDGVAPLEIDACAWGIDTPNAAANGWRNAWTPICTLASGSGVEIQPGQTGQFLVDVGACLSGPCGPGWGGDQVAGTYRMRAALFSAAQGPAITAASNAFVLIQLP